MNHWKRIFSVVAIAAITLVSQGAWAHATLLSSMPAASAELDKAPKEISLKFNEKLEEAFSFIKLTDNTQREIVVAKAHLDAEDPTQLKLDLPPLPKGTYAVSWSAMTYDGHKRKGDFTFTVK